MIAVDTNVLVRLVVDEHPSQHAAARQFFSQRHAASPAYVSLVVIVEFVWILSKVYGYSHQTIADLLLAFLRSPDFVIEKDRLVAHGIELSMQPKVDMIDVLISGLAELEHCSRVVTFDKNAAKRIPGMELLA